MTPPGYEFRWSVVLDNWQGFLLGAWIDVWVTLVGFGLACLLGLGIALLRLSTSPALSMPAFVAVQIFRGVPLYVMLLWVYFGLSRMLGINFSNFQGVIIALTLTGAGYTSEIFRASIGAIERGQLEAARAVGMHSFGIYRRIVLPQALRIAVPPLGNVFVGLLKGATIMAVLAVPDMVLLAMHLNTTYFTPFEAFTAVLVILVALVLIASAVLVVLERALRLP
jgi:His/Glu/Gln/Arg/opine family amino acid ABC transporter permease subunit